MTLSDLVEKVEAHAPGSMIPRDWILDELSKATGAAAGVSNWVDRQRASEITGESVDFLSARAVHWRGAPYAEIRTRKNDPTKRKSPWLFAEDDCWAYRRKKDLASPVHEPAEVPSTTDNDDVDAIAERYARKATARL